jgi:membrane-bound lytic murein transglycosylase D
MMSVCTAAFADDERPLRTDRETYVAAAEAYHRTATAQIPGIDKASTQFYINLYSGKNKLNWLAQVLERGEPYMAFIREQIESRALPKELLYLPVIESEFVITAKSKSGATGLWQFMENSMKPYLIKNEWIDERMDFWKSTEAALSKLESNYKQFGDWPLALAAYNIGAGALKQIISKTGINDYWTLSNYDKLSKNAAAYVPKLLAIAHIAENPRRYGLEVNWPYHYTWSRIAINKPLDLNILSEHTGIDSARLINANRELLFGVTPPGGNYLLKVPNAHYEAVINLTMRTDINLAKHFVHTISKGDTLYALARIYGVSVNDILNRNKGIAAHQLQIGQQVIIPL